MAFTKASLRALALAAPLALVLAGCNGSTDDGPVEGDPIEAIPAPDGGSWLDTVTVSESDGYIVGNPDAPLKLVEYASHTCGGCAMFAQQAKEKLKSDYISSGVVSFEQRNLVRDPIDLTIATLVRCSTKENMQPLSDEAWKVLNETFANVQENGAAYEASSSQPLEQRFITIAEAAGLIDFFAARGLSSDQARTCLADKAKVEAIADNSSTQADELNINATPTFILNGRTLDVTSWGDLEPILQRAGAR
ncbi:MAG: thioredoxin domain-containing protein [Pseudomonadota bacterium]